MSMDAVAMIGLWSDRLGAIASNVNELAETDTAKRVRIRWREGVYQGATAQVAEAAIESLERVLKAYELLADAVARAREAERGTMFESREARAQRVAEILEAPSIRRSIRQVGIADRGLLGAAQEMERVSASTLLASMQKDYEQARDGLNLIARAESDCSAGSGRLQQDYAVLEQRAARLQGDADRPQLLALQHMGADPVAAQQGFEAMARSLAAWAVDLDRLEAERLEATSAVELGATLLDQLKASVATHQQRVEQVRQLLGAQEADSLDNPAALQLGTLQAWHQTLQSTLAAGQWPAVAVGGRRLRTALENVMAMAAQALARAEARTTLPEDLAGLFRALGAKQRALCSTGLDERCALVRERIRQALEARPLDAVLVQGLLKQYADVVNTGA